MNIYYSTKQDDLQTKMINRMQCTLEQHFDFRKMLKGHFK